jgi:hypothetical protein
MSLLWMLACGVLILWGAAVLAPPALDRRLQGLLFALALLAVAPALRPGVVLGPLDTNVPHLPWATAADRGYLSKGSSLNDVTLQLVPWQAEARRQILAGHLPLLNPYSGAGEALLGNGQAAPYSFVSLLSLPVSPLHAQALRAFLKVLLALLGTFLAARELGGRPEFSLVAAVAYAFGGSLSVWQLFPHSEVMAIFPFAWLGLERTLRDPDDVRARLLLFLAAGGLLLAGHPETAFLGGLTLVVRSVMALRANRKGFAVALIVMCLAAGATSFFNLPLVDTVLSSEKLGQQGGGRDPGLGTGGPWWGSLTSMAAPGIFGTPQRSSEHGPAPFHWLSEGTIGLLCMVFALGGVAAFGVKTKSERFLAGLAILAFALYFDLLGIPSRLFALPGFSAIALRYVAYLGGFALALLAARALTLWCVAETTGRREKAGLIAAAVVGAVLAVVSHSIVVGFWQRTGALGHLAPDVQGEASFHWWIALLTAAGLFVCLGLRRRPVLLGCLAAGLTSLQLLSGFGGYTPAVGSQLAYPPLPLIDRLHQDPRPFRVVGTRGVFFPNSSTWYQIADIRSHDPTEPARYVDWLVDLLSLDRRTYKKQFRRPLPSQEPFLRLLGVRYLLSGRDLALKAPWIDRGLFRETRLWELEGETRWAFFPTDVVGVDSALAARDVIRHEPNPYAVASLEGPGAMARQANGEARVIRVVVETGKIRVGIEVKQPAWLVLSQSAIRGWRASGERGGLETATADGALLAVHVPAGRGVVTLRYLPAAFLIGVFCSVLSLVGFAVLSLRSGW